MTSSEEKRSYKASEMHADVEREIDRLRSQALWGWEKESRNLGWFGLKDGMSILEVGSGPGFVTEQLLTLYPRSDITCVEIDPDLIKRAENYLRDRVQGRYRIVEGDLMHMDFPDNSFAFAYGRFIFQHLPDPLGAMKEIYRVLKPGGKLAIADVDDGLGHIFDPPSAEADAVEAKLSTLQANQGGNRFIGRRLWRLLEAAGYHNVDLEAHAMHSDKIPIENMIPKDWDSAHWSLCSRRA